MKTKNIFSSFLLLLAAVLWGFAFAAQEGASKIGAFSLGAARSMLAFFFLIFVIIVLDFSTKSERRLVCKKGIDFNKNELIGGCVCGIVLALASALQQLGINGGTDSGKSAFITAIYVVLVPVYALLLGHKSSLNCWIGVGISVVGFYLLCIKSDFSIIPSDMLVLGCSLIFPIHILTINHFATKCDGVRMSAIQFLVAGVINIIAAVIFESPSEQITLITKNPLPIIYLGIVSSGIAYTLQIIGQRRTNPTAASIILSMESVFGVVGTSLFFGTRLSAREYIGALIILIAVIISQISLGKKASQKEESGSAS